MDRIKKILLVAISFLVILTACQKQDMNPIEENPIEEEEPIVDKFNHLYDTRNVQVAKEIYVIDMKNLKGADEVMLAVSLQGIVAQTGAAIYIHTDGPSSRYWFSELSQNYSEVDSVWLLVETFRSHIPESTYILYTPYTESMNVATTLSGIEQSLMISERLESQAIEYGFVLKRDVRQRTTRWVIEHFKDKINFKAIASQPINNLANRDFIISQKGLIITHIQNDLEGFESFIPSDTPMLGWGTDEVSDVYHLSQRGITTIASDHAWNVSFLAQIDNVSFSQNDFKTIESDSNKHYVSFILTDGDNIQWLLGNDHFFHESRFGNQKRGTIPMGWTVAPILYTLAPSVLKSYYSNASSNDEFIGGPSGIGYINPDVYPVDALELNALRTNEYYEKTDLNYMTVIGSQHNFEQNIDVMNAYASQPNIDGGFIFANFDAYKGYRGKLWWFNDKPFLSVREALWDLDDLQPLANRINQSVINPRIVDGYTLIIIHAWSHDYDDVLALSQLFEDHIEIVLPGQMMSLIQSNVSKTTQIPV